MNIKTHILNTSGNLSPHKDVIQKTVASVVEKVKKRMKLDNIDIVVKESERPESLKDIDGVVGYCPSGNFVELGIDYAHPSFRKNTKAIIERTLCHELHHAMRRQAGVKIFGGFFLECMFSEGLADYFAYEMTGEFPIWSTFISIKNKDKLMKKARRKFNQKITYKDYEDWFTVGSKELKILRWTGYTLGLEMAKNYFEKNPTKSASSIVKVPVWKLKLHNIS